jgi:hypothetical protein
MSECPPEFYECLTEEEYDDILELFEENDMVMLFFSETLVKLRWTFTHCWVTAVLQPPTVMQSTDIV